jgi:hypothetical protein
MNLRMPPRCKPWKLIEGLLERASKLSEEAGTPFKKAGPVKQYHTTSVAAGRGARAARRFKTEMLEDV